jgi:hypothetical protein
MKTIFALVLAVAAWSPVCGQNLETPAPRPNPPLPYSAAVDSSIPAYKPVKRLS